MPNTKKNRPSVWLIVGVAALIALLILWLTMADAAGDTDVSSDTNFATDNVEMTTPGTGAAESPGL